MKLSGLTIKGSNKIINQDSYGIKKYKKVIYLAVADGLGSKKYSDEGSKLICNILGRFIKKKYSCLNVISKEKIFELIYKEWIKQAYKYGINNCSTTFLFTFFSKKRIFSFRIGDGFIFLKTNKREIVLCDDKLESFSNITDCLNENTNLKNIEIIDIKNEILESCIIMTDGIDLYPDNKKTYKKFSNEFIDEYKEKKVFEINKSIFKWMDEWESKDDKTISYYIR